LVGGVAVIRVGAATETAMKEKKMRVEDAVNATRAAAQEGIVPGGGVALVRAARALEKLDVEGDELTGVQLLRRAMQEPLRRIAENAGTDGAVVIGRVEDSKGKTGLQRRHNKYEDLVAAGIIDPTKVVRTALQNAVSIAGFCSRPTPPSRTRPSRSRRRPRPCPEAKTTTSNSVSQRLKERGESVWEMSPRFRPSPFNAEGASVAENLLPAV
jgi:chaperonin GroEL